MFSVIIPLYNKEKYIKRAIESVLNQTYQNFEIIIVNDGSTDKSLDILKEIKDSRIKIINQENQGVAAARNRGIKEAKYEYIAFLDADDEWEKEYLKTIKDLIYRYPKCKFFATNYKIIESNGNIKYPRINRLSKNFREGIIDSKKYFELACQSDPIINSSSVCVNKESLKLIGMFPLGVKGGEDLITWSKLAINYNLAYKYDVHLSIFHRDIDKKNNKKYNIRVNCYENDFVGQELIKLYETNNITYLKNYIAYWFKIKINIFLRAQQYEKAKKEFLIYKKYAKKDKKYLFYLFLIYGPMPMKLKRIIINRIWGEL